MRVLATALGSLALGLSTASGGTSLRITVWATPTSQPRVTTLRCTPPGGTVAHPVSACRRLAKLGRTAFAPTPPGTACTMIYGGPQRAIVSGTFEGRRVWTTFRRRDGCEIERWNRAAFLLTS
jgi:hypothetical protein